MSTGVHEPDLLVVGPNPAIDVYYCLDRFNAGDVNRVASVRRVPGGKANNLARAYRSLGGNPLTTGIVAGETGRWILDGLSAEGIAHDYVCAEGESRHTVSIVELSGTTVLLEPGPTIDARTFQQLETKVSGRAGSVPAVAITGSALPGKWSPTSLGMLVFAARSVSNAFIAVDTSGDALSFAAVAYPHLIKVNRDEFEHAFRTSKAQQNIERVFERLASDGVQMLCLTDGARGALILSEHDRFVVRTKVERTVSTAGAGDAFLAGMLFAIRHGDPLQEAARLASAAAAAALQRIEAGFIDRPAVEAALERTELLDAADFFAGGQA